jgi:hypothetical protein
MSLAPEIYYTLLYFAYFCQVHFPSVSNYDSNPGVSVRFIDSTTLLLHVFCQEHFASDSNYDPNPAASGRFIDSTTLPLHGDPIHNVYDVPLAPWKLADWGIISSITYRKIES